MREKRWSLCLALTTALVLVESTNVLSAGADSCAQLDRLSYRSLRWAEVAGTIIHAGPAGDEAWTVEIQANASYMVVDDPARGGAPSIVLGKAGGELRKRPDGTPHPCDLAVEGEVGPFHSIIGNAEYRIRVECDAPGNDGSGPGALVLEGESCANRLRGSIQDPAAGETTWDLVIRPVPPPPFADFCDSLFSAGAGDMQLLFLGLAPSLRDEGVMDAYREEMAALSVRSAALDLSYQQILWTCRKLDAAWLGDETGPGAGSYEDLMAKWPEATHVWSAHNREFQTALASALDAIAARAGTETTRREILDMAERARASAAEEAP